MLSSRYLPIFVLFVFGYSLCQASDDPTAVFMAHLDASTADLWSQFETDDDHVFLRDDLETFIQSYDTDNSTHVTRNEFFDHFLRDDPDLGSIAWGLFIEFDSNQDGLVDSKDLDAVYSRIDVNHDLRVDETEFRGYFKSLLTVLFLLHIQGVPEPGTIV